MKDFNYDYSDFNLPEGKIEAEPECIKHKRNKQHKKIEQKIKLRNSKRFFLRNGVECLDNLFAREIRGF